MTHRRNDPVLYGLIFGSLMATRVIAAIVLPVYDDAFITFRCARNLAAGIGLVYQPGEWILVTTSPGYGLILGAVYLLHLPMPGAAIAINILADAALLGLTLLCLEPALRRPAAIVLGSLFTASPLMNRISVGAMEMETFMAVSLAAVALFLRSRPLAAALVASLSVSLRPEGLILTCVLLGLAWIASRRQGAATTLVAAAVLGGFGALVSALYGGPLPHGMLAKWNAPPSGLVETLGHLVAGDPLILLCIAPALLASTRLRHDPLIRILSLWAGSWILLFLLARPRMWSWYGGPVSYMLLVLATRGFLVLMDRLPRARRILDAAPVRAALILIPLLGWVVILAGKGPSLVTRHVYGPIARWCSEHRDESAALAGSDIGAVGYYCNMRIEDISGLVWPEGLRYRTAQDLIADRRPDYLFLTNVKAYTEMMGRKPQTDLYEPIGRFSPDGRKEPILERGGTDEWAQSYLLFRRVPPR